MFVFFTLNIIFWLCWRACVHWRLWAV